MVASTFHWSFVDVMTLKLLSTWWVMLSMVYLPEQLVQLGTSPWVPCLSQTHIPCTLTHAMDLLLLAKTPLGQTDCFCPGQSENAAIVVFMHRYKLDLLFYFKQAIQLTQKRQKGKARWRTFMLPLMEPFPDL